MSTEEETMCYVAEDPEHPGTAWAASVDRPEDAKAVAKDVARWIKKGAHVKRVPVTQAREMLTQWLKNKQEEKK